jgi:hypothetical protein
MSSLGKFPSLKKITIQSIFLAFVTLVANRTAGVFEHFFRSNDRATPSRIWVETVSQYSEVSYLALDYFVYLLCLFVAFLVFNAFRERP